MRRGDARLTDLDYLARLRDRGVRDTDGVFLIEGVRFVVSAFDRGADVLSLVVAPELLKSPVGQMVARRKRQAGLPTLRVSADAFRSLSILGEPQGIAAVVRKRADRLAASRRGLFVALERSRFPGNLGTLMRTAAAAGAAGVIALSDEVDFHDPRALRASMGALFHLALPRVDHAALGAWAADSGARVIGTDAAARHDYRRARYGRATVLMVGGERCGLTDAQRALCHDLVRIPMARGIDSLNVAVATALVLYQARGRA